MTGIVTSKMSVAFSITKLFFKIVIVTEGVKGLTDLTGSYGKLLLGNPVKSNQFHSTGDPPLWTKEPPLNAPFSNSSGLRLECQATGEPTPTIEWYQEDELITHNLHGIRIIMNNGTMVFPPFSPDQFREDVHIASYHCRARNRLGTIVSKPVKARGVLDQDYSVSVHDAIVIQGNTAILRCDIPDSVKEHVAVTSWLHEEGTAIEIVPEREPRGKYTLLQSGDLLIHHTSTYDTYKKYVCKTQHKLANIRRRNIKPARLVLSEPAGTIIPRLVEPADPHQRLDRKMQTGEHILMPCVAHGYPVPESTWFRVDGVGLRQVLPSARFKFHLEVLAIHDLQVDDSGIYVCIMNNTVGAERIEVNLTVRNQLSARIDPERQTIDLNQPASFRCFYSGWPIERVEWLKNGQQFQTGNSKYFSSANGTLKLLSVQEGDDGIYQCLISNDDDTAIATTYLWLGDSKPTLLYRFSEQTLQPGPSVSLKCIAKGNPPPRITWQLDGFPLPQNDRYVVGHYVTIHDDVISHVNISRVESKDGGTFSCTATNTVGAVTHMARLNIYGPPFIRGVPAVKAVEGHPISIECPASGYPISRLTWQKDGFELSNTNRHTLFANGTLVLYAGNKLHDEGYYSCTAFSDRDESHSGTVQVKVLTPPTIMPFLFPNKLLSEGMRSAVSCQILEGSLPIVFHWSKNGQIIDGTSGLGVGSPSIFDLSSGFSNPVAIRSNDEYSSTLIIDRLDFSHRGNYTCTATNAAGVSSHSAELTVNVPPKWVQEPQDVQGLVGQDLILPCLVEGYPEPSTVWTRANDFGVLNYQILPAGISYNQFMNGSLLISSVDKSSEGTYTCTAQNGIRSPIAKTVNVTVNAPPRFMESSVRLSARKGDKASMVCETNGDTPMEITWKRNGIPISENEDARYSILEHVAGTDGFSRFTISPVLDQDEGQITCEASNRFGRDMKHFSLSIEDVPSSPSGVRLSSIKSRSLEISWLGPHDGNAPILNYVIEYINIPDGRDGGERQRRKMTAPGDSVNLNVQNLRPGTMYKFHVSAENRHGVGSESQAVTTRTLEEAPNASPRNLNVLSKTSTELEISWEAPPYTHWNSERLSYKLGYREIGDTNGFEYVEGSHASVDLFSKTTLHSLRKFTTYQIIVQAYNKEGTGPASSALIATTTEDVPSGPPENLHCQSRGPNSLLLEWSKPKREHRNGIIRGYWLQYYPRVLWYETNGRLLTRETEGELLELDGLETYTNYSIRVAAYTRFGKHPQQRKVPSAPSDIKAVTSGENSVIVSWRSPAHTNGLIQKYTVFRREINTGQEVDVRESSVLSGPNYLELSALQGNRRYDFWIKAETSKGYGPSSDITSIILGRTVRARVVSFGEVLAVPWKSNLVLDCIHVGIPNPSVQWLHKMRPIQENSKHQIFPNASLSIQHLSEVDEGDYICSVQNAHGNDQIVYEIIVQIPPMSPVVNLNNATHDSIEVLWHGRRSRKQPLLGFSLHYRREHGQWQQLEADPLTERMWLEGLQCGANYSVYMEAFSHVGPGNPSDVLFTKTAGREPDVPNPSELLEVNKTSITVRLDAFGTGGCPMLYFVIEYRQEMLPKYVMVANNISPRDNEYTIRGLDSATRYFIKVTAHNTAGSSVAEYPFSTLTSLGATLPPPVHNSRERSSSSAIVMSIKILSTIFLAACFIVAIFYFAMFVRKWNRKREIERRPYPPPSPSSYIETRPLRLQSRGGTKFKIRTDVSPILPPFKSSDPLCNPLESGGGTSAVSFGSQGLWNKDSICPYATFQLTAEQQQQQQQQLLQQQQQQQQISIQLQHHGQLEVSNGGSCLKTRIFGPPTNEIHGFVYRPDHAINTETFKLIPSREPMYAKLGNARELISSGQESTDTEVKKVLTLQFPVAEFDPKYDSDSDFDYRQKPPRPRPRRKSRRRASHSSSSSAESLSPLPRVRSIEELDFPTTTFGAVVLNSKRSHQNWRGHIRQHRHQLIPLRQQHQQHQQQQETNFISFGSGTILPPARFSDHQAHANHQPEIRTLGRPGKKVHRQIHV